MTESMVLALSEKQTTTMKYISEKQKMKRKFKPRTSLNVNEGEKLEGLRFERDSGIEMDF